MTRLEYTTTDNGMGSQVRGENKFFTNEPNFPLDSKPKKTGSILDQAKAIIYGDREKTYGHPAKNLNTIAQLWNTYFDSISAKDKNVSVQYVNAQDVAVMMILLKVARLANTPGHEDTLVDICGYAALIERVQDCPPSDGKNLNT
jgi:hypothetical protein